MKQAMLLLLLATAAMARTPVSGWCEQGNQVVSTTGVPNSTTKVQRSYPSCTVRVTIYNGGAATLFSDDSGTSLSNPFTANSNGSWSFFADANTYTVTLSGAGIAAPFSMNYAVSGGTNGTVTVVASGSLTSGTIVTGGGSQTLQTACLTCTLDSSGNMSLPGTLAVTGHVTLEGVTSAGATGTTNLVFSNSPTLVAPALGTPVSVNLGNAISTGVTGTLPVANGGTNGTTVTAAFDNLAPTTTKGDIIVHNGSDNIRFGVCPDTQAIIGDSGQASGLNCGAVPTVSGLTTNQILRAGSTSSIVNSAISDNGTVVTSTEQIKAPSLSLGVTPPSLTNGTGTAVAMLEGTAPATCIAAGVDCLYPDSTAHAIKVSYNNGTAYRISQVIANGTAALGTSLINSGACATAVTTAATGTLTTDVVHWSFNGDPTGVTGYAAAAGGTLTINAYPTSGNFVVKVCNSTGGGITPGAITLNWIVER